MNKHFLTIFQVIFLFYFNSNCQTIDNTLGYNQALETFSNGNNYHRYKFIKNYIQPDSLKRISVKTESIDWLGLYKNVIFEKKGLSDSCIYVVCHYDKVDMNILSFSNLLINGTLDCILSNMYLSKGAYDNGSGVIISLKTLINILSKETHYTYRFLFAGMEEYGLRGSRRHVSGMKKEEWDNVFLAINIDMVGKASLKGISVSENVSNDVLLKIAEKVCKNDNFILERNNLPEYASSDFASFNGQNFAKDFSSSFDSNIIGCLIPQKSYFTSRKKPIPTISFTDSATVRTSDLLSLLSPVGFGQEHSYKDNMRVVDTMNLVNYVGFLTDYIEYLDRNIVNIKSSRIRYPALPVDLKEPKLISHHDL